MKYPKQLLEQIATGYIVQISTDHIYNTNIVFAGEGQSWQESGEGEWQHQEIHAADQGGQKDKKTKRQKDRKTKRQKDKKTKRQKTKRQTDKKTKRQNDKKTKRQKDKKTKRQKDNKTIRQKDNSYIWCNISWNL